ncbi:MAG: SLC13 family permease [Rhizobiales bacterium]|nr:SLC13 family permease [Hyphomicrobiales bacterium]
MTTEQILALSLVAGMMAMFVWGRFRYDLVAVATLLLAVAAGVVPAKDMFSGFSDDITIIVGSALVVSAAIGRSGIMEYAVRRTLPQSLHLRAQLSVLVVTVAVLSTFVKNIGALAIMLPIALQFAKRSNVPPSVFLMPMSFASLLGGLVTLVGTSPNIVVSRVREDLTGQPFQMLDYAPVGLILTACGLVFMIWFHWLVPRRTRVDLSARDAVEIEDYLVEATVPAKAASEGMTIAKLLELAGEDVAVISILRGGVQQVRPLPDATLDVDDVLLLEGPADSIDRLVVDAGLDLTGQRGVAPSDETGTVINIEAVVAGHSVLVGMTAETIRLFHTRGVNLLAVSRRNERLSQKLGSVTFRAGDILMLQGRETGLAILMRDMGLLPLAERKMLLGSVRHAAVPVVILVAAMLASSLGVVPVATAFFAAAAAMALFRVLPLRDLYTSVEAPILIMLAALIPVSQSLQATQATDLLAQWLSSAGAGLPVHGAIALVLVTAMAVTPFLNNAATVLVVAPIAARFAEGLGYRPEAFLMAVAIGAGCDFLTPIGHQCNTLVMGPGGYRFGDYIRLGLPLSLLVVLVAVPALAFFWQG